jgi:hypothetical protein
MTTSNNMTEQRLQDALSRLLEGKPVNTRLDGRISIKRINDEAGLTHGAIYYYKDFICKAKVEIELFKKSKKSSDILDNAVESLPETKKLRRERDNEKRLKNEYREQVGNLKHLSDEVVKVNVSLAFRVLELENEIRRQSDEKIVHLPR